MVIFLKKKLNNNLIKKSLKLKSNINNFKSFLLNFGPQHPAAHGILKCSCNFVGEVISSVDIVFGLLHRGTEKLFEFHGMLCNIPYMDRLDYVSNIIQEHSLIVSIENSFKRSADFNLNIFRIICSEMSRILNHLLTVSAICLDMGSMGPIMWAFEEREQIMEIFERISGARMHTALFLPFSTSALLYDDFFFKDLLFMLNRGSRFICGSFLSLFNNRSLKTRLVGVGFFSKKKLLSYGITGVILRSCGVKLDFRLFNNNSDYYNIFSALSFRSFVSKKSDCYDRFIIRAKEILESFRIINQCLSLIKISYIFKKTKYKYMESVISHFKESSYFFNNNSGVFFGEVEGPKGIVKSILVLTNSYFPYRFILKSPVAHNMNLITTLGNNNTFSAFVASFCSLDIVLGEIDR